MTTDPTDRESLIESLRRRAAFHFEHDPRPQLVVAPEGAILEVNAAARRSLESVPGTLEELIPTLEDVAAVESGETVACELADGRLINASWSHLPTEEGGAILVTLQPAQRGAELAIADAFDAIGSVTEQVLHEVRNLILPLTVQLDLALASVDTDSSTYEALLEMQSSCRRCGVTLDRIETVTDPGWQPGALMHARDLFERTRLILRYALPDRVRVQIDAPETLPMVRAQLRHLQRALLKIVARGPREALRRVVLRAVPTEDHIWLEVVLECKEGTPLETRDRIMSSLDSVRSDDIIDEAVEVEDGRVLVRLAVDTLDKRAPHRTRDAVRAGRVLLLHDDALRREILRNFLSERGFSVSCHAGGEDGGAHDVMVVDATCVHGAPDFSPRVVLGADARTVSEGVVPVPAPYRLDDVVAAVTASLPAKESS